MSASTVVKEEAGAFPGKEEEEMPAENSELEQDKKHLAGEGQSSPNKE